MKERARSPMIEKHFGGDVRVNNVIRRTQRYAHFSCANPNHSRHRIPSMQYAVMGCGAAGLRSFGSKSSKSLRLVFPVATFLLIVLGMHRLPSR